MMTTSRYTDANGAAFRAKFQSRIDAGRAALGATMATIDRQVPQDAIVRARALRFEPSSQGVMMKLGDTGPATKLHSNARSQLAGLTKISHMGTVLNALTSQGPWGVELAADNLNKIFAQHPDKFLVRKVEDDYRSVLSDRFRRYDVRPIVGAFYEKMIKAGALPLEARISDTKVRLRVVLPEIYEPIPNEPMLYGLELGNSDHGDGKVLIASFVERFICTNLATAQDFINKVHLGSRLTDDIAFSAKTMISDTNTVVGMIGDVTKHALLPATIDKLFGNMKAAYEKPAEFKDHKSRLAKILTKSELENAEKIYASDDVTILPPVKSQWRVSNLISHIANLEQDVNRKLQLQSFAGALALGGPVVDVDAAEVAA